MPDPLRAAPEGEGPQPIILTVEEVERRHTQDLRDIARTLYEVGERSNQPLTDRIRILGAEADRLRDENAALRHQLAAAERVIEAAGWMPRRTVIGGSNADVASYRIANGEIWGLDHALSRYEERYPSLSSPRVPVTPTPPTPEKP